MSSGFACIFCGGRPVTREHLWPDWLRREANIRGRSEHRIEAEVDGVETRDITFETPPFNQVVRAVCADCNAGWMSAVEATAKPLLLDLINGRGAALSADDQRALASWAFLKACVFDQLHRGDGTVPNEHKRRLFTYQQPPATGVAIWLGTYEAQELGHYAYQGLLIAREGDPDPEEPTIYVVTITAGALIVQVAGSLIPELSFDGLQLPPELHVVKIWPGPNDPVEFGQTHVMDHPTMVGFTKMLYNVMGRLTGAAHPAR